MHLSQIYPRFSIEDDWGRVIEFNRSNAGYTRRLLNAGMPGIPLQSEETVSRHTYAMALLRHIEDVSENAPTELLSGAPVSPGLDEFFGPRQTPIAPTGK